MGFSQGWEINTDRKCSKIKRNKDRSSHFFHIFLLRAPQMPCLKEAQEVLFDVHIVDT